MNTLILHQLPKRLVLSKPNENMYVLGVLDDYTRCVWLILLENKTAQNVMFATGKALGVLDLLYGMSFKAMMTDNGSEFGAGRQAKNKDTHPYEVLLHNMEIEHRYTAPYHPQTNGKVG